MCAWSINMRWLSVCEGREKEIGCRTNERERVFISTDIMVCRWNKINENTHTILVLMSAQQWVWFTMDGQNHYSNGMEINVLKFRYISRSPTMINDSLMTIFPLRNSYLPTYLFVFTWSNVQINQWFRHTYDFHWLSPNSQLRWSFFINWVSFLRDFRLHTEIRQTNKIIWNKYWPKADHILPIRSIKNVITFYFEWFSYVSIEIQSRFELRPN